MSVIDVPSIIRTGPVTFRECVACEGVGKPRCEICLGTGRITVDVQPFVTLEAIAEHVGSLVSALRKAGIDPADQTIGSPGYHLNAMRGGMANLFQQLVLLLPEEFARTEGE
jgi:hypothetical protein